MQLIVAAVVIVAGVYDIRFRRIPNWLVLPALLLGFALNTFLYGFGGLKDSGLGFGLAILFYMPLYLLRGRGAGDVKLMAALGALVGWRNWLIIFVISGLLGGVLALVLILFARRFRRTFSNLGWIIWDLVHFRAPYLRSEELDVTSPKSVRLPHGAVIALGCLTFLGAGRLMTG